MRLSSRAVSWILIVTLSLSPLMAQQQPAPKIANSRVVQVVDENNNPLVGTSILMALPGSLPSNPIPVPETKPPGKTKSTLLVLLLLGGAATAIILALSGGGDKSTPPAPVVTPTTVQPTIITAGTPRVGSPN